MPTPKSTSLKRSPKASESSFRELIRIMGLLEKIMEPYFSQFGISGAQWGVLRNLHRAEEEGMDSLRLTDLSNRLLIRPPSVTGVVDRLERAGLVVRDNSPNDLRSKRVCLTAKARELVRKVLIKHSDQIASLMGGLEEGEQEVFFGLLHQTRNHLEELARGGKSSLTG